MAETKAVPPGKIESALDRATHHPITLFVESVNTEPHIEMGLERRKTTIDAEISVQQIKTMIEELQKHIEHMPHRGAIRIRFTGRIFM